MPWIRFERFKYLNPLAPHVAMGERNRRYLWDGSGDGAVNVPFEEDVIKLLSPTNGDRSPYSVAWDRHGVEFDEQGKEIESQAVETTGDELEPPKEPLEPASTPEQERPRRGPGRPKRIQ